MGKTRILVLDVLKPHTPGVIEFASSLSDLQGVDGVDITVIEVEKDVENVKITLKGSNIIFDEVKNVLEAEGAAIHGVDKVACGSEIIEEAATHQDQR